MQTIYHICILLVILLASISTSSATRTRPWLLHHSTDIVQQKHHHRSLLQQPPPPQFTSVTTGNGLTCGVTTEGDAYCTGTNIPIYNPTTSGSTGTTSSSTFIPVTPGTKWKSLSSSDSLICGVTQQGTAQCWGKYATTEQGILGTVPNTGAVNFEGSDWKSISTSPDNICGVKVDGSAWCTGKNDFGQVGGGTSNGGVVDQMVQISGGGGPSNLVWTQVVSCGGGYTCAIEQQFRDAYCFGSDSSGNLGLNNPNREGTFSTPQKVDTKGGWSSISCNVDTNGAKTTCGVKSDDGSVTNQAYCWGASKTQPEAQLSQTPQLVTNADPNANINWQSISVGETHVCGVAKDGQGLCFGNNDQGELGIGQAGGGIRSTPTPISGNIKFQTINSGPEYTCGIKAGTQDVVCFGNNENNQLGIGQTAPPGPMAAPTETVVSTSIPPGSAPGLGPSLGPNGAPGPGPRALVPVPLPKLTPTPLMAIPPPPQLIPAPGPGPAAAPPPIAGSPPPPPPPPAPVAIPASSGSSTNIGAIVGGVVGGVVLIAAGIGGFMWWRSKKAKDTKAWKVEENNQPAPATPLKWAPSGQSFKNGNGGGGAAGGGQVSSSDFANEPPQHADEYVDSGGNRVGASANGSTTKAVSFANGTNNGLQSGGGGIPGGSTTMFSASSSQFEAAPASDPSDDILKKYTDYLRNPNASASNIPSPFLNEAGAAAAATAMGLGAGAAVAGGYFMTTPSENRSKSKAVDTDSSGEQADDMERSIDITNDPLLQYIKSHVDSSGMSRNASLNQPTFSSELQLVPGQQLSAVPERQPSLPTEGALAMGAAAAAAAAAASPALNKRRKSGGLIDVRPWLIEFDQLDILRSLGAGSYGKVYLARYHETPVAVKILLDLPEQNEEEAANLSISSPMLSKLADEAALMAKMRHPNIVSFIGLCISPPAIASEYCRRGSLYEVLSEGKKSPLMTQHLSWCRRIKMALDAAKGILHLHMHDPIIIHRDIKSPNLLVTQAFEVKVTDFNLSRIMEDALSSKGGSSSGQVNPRWLAPEILLQNKPATPASDVFSFGVVLWELLTWELPWQNEKIYQITEYAADGTQLPIPPAAQLPGMPSDRAGAIPGLDPYLTLMKDCWRKNPKQRPNFQQIIGRLRLVLQAAAGGNSSTSGPRDA